MKCSYMKLFIVNDLTKNKWEKHEADKAKMLVVTEGIEFIADK